VHHVADKRKKKIPYKVWSETLKKKEDFKELCADWKIILKEILHSWMAEYDVDIDSVCRRVKSAEAFAAKKFNEIFSSKHPGQDVKVCRRLGNSVPILRVCKQTTGTR